MRIRRSKNENACITKKKGRACRLISTCARRKGHRTKEGEAKEGEAESDAVTDRSSSRLIGFTPVSTTFAPKL